MIFESTDNRYPTVEELVLCDLFRNIDLREMRGPSVSVSSAKSSSISNSTEQCRKSVGTYIYWLNCVYYQNHVAVIQTWIKHQHIEFVECGSTKARRFIEWVLQWRKFTVHTAINTQTHRVNTVKTFSIYHILIQLNTVLTSNTTHYYYYHNLLNVQIFFIILHAMVCCFFSSVNWTHLFVHIHTHILVLFSNYHGAPYDFDFRFDKQ